MYENQTQVSQSSQQPDTNIETTNATSAQQIINLLINGGSINGLINGHFYNGNTPSQANILQLKNDSLYKSIFESYSDLLIRFLFPVLQRLTYNTDRIYLDYEIENILKNTYVKEYVETLRVRINHLTQGDVTKSKFREIHTYDIDVTIDNYKETNVGRSIELDYAEEVAAIMEYIYFKDEKTTSNHAAQIFNDLFQTINTTIDNPDIIENILTSRVLFKSVFSDIESDRKSQDPDTNTNSSARILQKILSQFDARPSETFQTKIQSLFTQTSNNGNFIHEFTKSVIDDDTIMGDARTPSDIRATLLSEYIESDNFFIKSYSSSSLFPRVLEQNHEYGTINITDSSGKHTLSGSNLTEAGTDFVVTDQNSIILDRVTFFAQNPDTEHLDFYFDKERLIIDINSSDFVEEISAHKVKTGKNESFELFVSGLDCSCNRINETEDKDKINYEFTEQNGTPLANIVIQNIQNTDKVLIKIFGQNKLPENREFVFELEHKDLNKTIRRSFSMISSNTTPVNGLETISIEYDKVYSIDNELKNTNLDEVSDKALFLKDQLVFQIYRYLLKNKDYADIASDRIKFYNEIRVTCEQYLSYGRKNREWNDTSAYNNIYKTYMKDIKYPVDKSYTVINPIDNFLDNLNKNDILDDFIRSVDLVSFKLPKHDVYPLKVPTNGLFYSEFQTFVENIAKPKIEEKNNPESNIFYNYMVNAYTPKNDKISRYAIFEAVYISLQDPVMRGSLEGKLRNYMYSEYKSEYFYMKHNERFIRDMFLKDLNDNDPRTSSKLGIVKRMKTHPQEMPPDLFDNGRDDIFRQIFSYLKTGKYPTYNQSNTSVTDNATLVDQTDKINFVKAICNHQFLTNLLCTVDNDTNNENYKLFWFIINELDDAARIALFSDDVGDSIPTSVGDTDSKRVKQLKQILKLAEKKVKVFQRFWLLNLLQYDNKPFQDKIDLETITGATSGVALYIKNIVYKLKPETHKLIRLLNKHGIFDISGMSSDDEISKNKLCKNLLHGFQHKYNKNAVAATNSSLQMFVDIFNKRSTILSKLKKSWVKYTDGTSNETHQVYPKVFKDHYIHLDANGKDASGIIPPHYTREFGFSFLLKVYSQSNVLDAIKRMIELPKHKKIDIGWNQNTLEKDQSFYNISNNRIRAIRISNTGESIKDIDSTQRKAMMMYMLFDMRERNILYTMIKNPSFTKRYITKFKRRLEYLYLIIKAMKDDLNLGIQTTDHERYQRHIIMESILDETMQATFYTMTPEKLMNNPNYENIRENMAKLFREKVTNFTEYSIVNRIKDILRKVTYRVLFNSREIEAKKFFGSYIKADDEIYFETLQWFCVLKFYMKKNDILFSLIKLVKPKPIPTPYNTPPFQYDFMSYNIDVSERTIKYNVLDSLYDYFKSGGVCDLDGSNNIFKTNYSADFVFDVLEGNKYIGNTYDKGLMANTDFEKDMLKRILYPYDEGPGKDVSVLYSNWVRDSSGEYTWYDIKEHDIVTIKTTQTPNSTYKLIQDISGATINGANDEISYDNQSTLNGPIKSLKLFCPYNHLEVDPIDGSGNRKAYVDYIDYIDSSKNSEQLNVDSSATSSDSTNIQKITSAEVLLKPSKTSKLIRLLRSPVNYKQIYNYLFFDEKVTDDDYTKARYDEMVNSGTIDFSEIFWIFSLNQSGKMLFEEFKDATEFSNTNSYAHTNKGLLTWALEYFSEDSTNEDDKNDAETWIGILQQERISTINLDQGDSPAMELLYRNNTEQDIHESVITDNICYYILNNISGNATLDNAQFQYSSDTLKMILMQLELFIDKSVTPKKFKTDWAHASLISSSHRLFTFHKDIVSVPEYTAFVMNSLSMPLKVFINGLQDNDFVKPHEMLSGTKPFIINEIYLNGQFCREENSNRQTLIKVLNESVNVSFFRDLVNSIILRYGRIADFFTIFSDEDERLEKMKLFYQAQEDGEILDKNGNSITIHSIVQRHYPDATAPNNINGYTVSETVDRIKIIISTIVNDDFASIDLLKFSVDDLTSQTMTELKDITDKFTKDKCKEILFELSTQLFPNMRRQLEKYIREWRMYINKNLPYVSTLLSAIPISVFSNPTVKLPTFFSFPHKEDIIDMIKSGTISSEDFNPNDDLETIKTKLINTVIANEDETHSNYKRFIYNLKLIDPTGNEYKFISKSFILSNFETVVQNLSYKKNGETEYEYLTDTSIFIWIESLPKDNREYIYNHPLLPYCTIEKAIQEKTHTISEIKNNKDLKAFFSLRLAYNLIRSRQDDFSDDAFLNFDSVPSEYCRSEINESDILNYRVDRYIDNTTQYMMNSCNNHNNSVMGAHRLHTYGPQVNYDDSGNIFEYGYPNQAHGKNNAENIHEVSFGNQIGSKLSLTENYMWTYKQILTDDMLPPNDDRVHLYSNGYLFNHKDFVKNIPSNVDKAFHSHNIITVTSLNPFNTNDYYKDKKTWTLSNDKTTRATHEYTEVHNDHWGGDHKNNYDNSDTPFLIYDITRTTFRNKSYWSLDQQTRDFADRWLEGNQEHIKRFQDPSSDDDNSVIKYIFDIHHMARIYDTHNVSRLQIVKEEQDTKYSRYGFETPQNMKTIKDIIINLEQDIQSEKYDGDDVLEESFLRRCSKNFNVDETPWATNNIVHIGEKPVKKFTYFMERFEHEIVEEIIRDQIDGSKGELINVITTYALHYGKYIDFSTCTDHTKHPKPDTMPKLDTLYDDLRKHFQQINLKKVNLTKIDNIIRTISMDKYNISKDQLFLNTLKNVSQPMISADLNEETGKYKDRFTQGIHTLSYVLRPFMLCEMENIHHSPQDKVKFDCKQLLPKETTNKGLSFNDLKTKKFNLPQDQKDTFMRTYVRTPFEMWQNHIVNFDHTNYNQNHNDIRLGNAEENYPHKNRKLYMHVYYQGQYKTHLKKLEESFDYWRKFYQLQDFEYVLKLGGGNFNFILDALGMKANDKTDMRKLFFGILGPVNKRLKEHIQRGADGKENSERFGLTEEQTEKMIKALFYVANHDPIKFSFGFGSINSVKSGVVELTEVQEERGRSIYESTVISIIDKNYFSKRLGFNEKQGMNDPREIKINMPHEERELLIEVLKAYNWPYNYMDGAIQDASGTAAVSTDTSGYIYKFDELEVDDSSDQPKIPTDRVDERDHGNYFEKLYDGNVSLYTNILENNTHKAEQIEIFLKTNWKLDQLDKSGITMRTNQDQEISVWNKPNSNSNSTELTNDIKNMLYDIEEYDSQTGEGQLIPEAQKFIFVDIPQSITENQISTLPDNSQVTMNNKTYTYLSPNSTNDHYRLTNDLDANDILTITYENSKVYVTRNAVDTDTSNDVKYVLLPHNDPDYQYLKHVKQYANKRGMLVSLNTSDLKTYFQVDNNDAYRLDRFIIDGNGTFVNLDDLDNIDGFNNKFPTQDRNSRKNFLFSVSSIETLTDGSKRITFSGTTQVLCDTNGNNATIGGVVLTETTAVTTSQFTKVIPFIPNIKEYHFDDSIIRKHFFHTINNKFDTQYGHKLNDTNSELIKPFIGKRTSSGLSNLKANTFKPYFSRENNSSLQWYMSAYNYFYHTQNANIFHPNVYLSNGLTKSLICANKATTGSSSKIELIPKYYALTPDKNSYSDYRLVNNDDVKYYNPYFCTSYPPPPSELKSLSDLKNASITTLQNYNLLHMTQNNDTKYLEVSGKMVDLDNEEISRSGCFMGTKDLSQTAWIPYYPDHINDENTKGNFVDITNIYDFKWDASDNVFYAHEKTTSSKTTIFYTDTEQHAFNTSNKVQVKQVLNNKLVDVYDGDYAASLKPFTLYSKIYEGTSTTLFHVVPTKMYTEPAGTKVLIPATNAYDTIVYENADFLIPFTYGDFPISKIQPQNRELVHFWPEEFVDVIIESTDPLNNDQITPHMANSITSFIAAASVPSPVEPPFIFEGWDIPYWRYIFRRLLAIQKQDLAEQMKINKANTQSEANVNFLTLLSYYMPYRSHDRVDPVLGLNDWLEFYCNMITNESSIGVQTTYGDFFLPVGSSKSGESVSSSDKMYYTAITYPRFHEDQIKNTTMNKLMRKLMPFVFKRDPNKTVILKSIDKIFDGFAKIKSQLKCQYEYIYENIMLGKKTNEQESAESSITRNLKFMLQHHLNYSQIISKSDVLFRANIIISKFSSDSIHHETGHSLYLFRRYKNNGVALKTKLERKFKLVLGIPEDVKIADYRGDYNDSALEGIMIRVQATIDSYPYGHSVEIKNLANTISAFNTHYKLYDSNLNGIFGLINLLKGTTQEKAKLKYAAIWNGREVRTLTDHLKLYEKLKKPIEYLSDTGQMANIVGSPTNTCLSSLNEVHIFKTIIQLHALPDYYRHKYHAVGGILIPIGKNKNGIDYDITNTDPFFKSNLTFNYNFFWNKKNLADTTGDYKSNILNDIKNAPLGEFGEHLLEYETNIDDLVYYPDQNIVDVHSNIKYDGTGTGYKAPKQKYNCVLGVHKFQRAQFFKDLFGGTATESFVEVNLRSVMNLQLASGTNNNGELAKYQQLILHKAARAISEWEAWRNQWEQTPELNIQHSKAWEDYVIAYKDLPDDKKHEWFHHMLPAIPNADNLRTEYNNLVDDYKCNKGRFTLDPGNKVFETLTSYFHLYIETLDYEYTNMIRQHSFDGTVQYRVSPTDLIKNNYLVKSIPNSYDCTNPLTNSSTALGQINKYSNYMARNLNFPSFFFHPLFEMDVNDDHSKSVNDNNSQTLLHGTLSDDVEMQIPHVRSFYTSEPSINKSFHDRKYKAFRSENFTYCLPTFVKLLLVSTDRDMKGVGMSFFNNFVPSPELDFIPGGRISYINEFDAFMHTVTVQDINLFYLQYLGYKEMSGTKQPDDDKSAYPAVIMKRLLKKPKYIKKFKKNVGTNLKRFKSKNVKKMGESLQQMYSEIMWFIDFIDDAFLASVRGLIAVYCEIEGTASLDGWDAESSFDNMLAQTENESKSASEEEQERNRNTMIQNREAIISRAKETSYSVFNPITMTYDAVLILLDILAMHPTAKAYKAVMTAIIALVYGSVVVIVIIEIEFTNWNSNNKLRKVLNGPDSYKGTKQIIATCGGKFTPLTLVDERFYIIVNEFFGGTQSTLAEHRFVQLPLSDFSFKDAYMPSSAMEGFALLQMIEMGETIKNYPDMRLNSQTTHTFSIIDEIYKSMFPPDPTQPSQKSMRSIVAANNATQTFASVRGAISIKKYVKFAGGKKGLNIPHRLKKKAAESKKGSFKKKILNKAVNYLFDETDPEKYMKQHRKDKMADDKTLQKLSKIERQKQKLQTGNLNEKQKKKLANLEKQKQKTSDKRLTNQTKANKKAKLYGVALDDEKFQKATSRDTLDGQVAEALRLENKRNNETWEANIFNQHLAKANGHRYNHGDHSGFIDQAIEPSVGINLQGPDENPNSWVQAVNQQNNDHFRNSLVTAEIKRSMDYRGKRRWISSYRRNYFYIGNSEEGENYNRWYDWLGLE